MDTFDFFSTDALALLAPSASDAANTTSLLTDSSDISLSSSSSSAADACGDTEFPIDFERVSGHTTYGCLHLIFDHFLRENFDSHCRYQSQCPPSISITLIIFVTTVVAG
ncbi:hypothetical protein CCMSSC00406_0008482 [Pleurotus cornucopiae]|uniref:Uncharacterized protein n=1 Tax=Pleurotus cornucopiae TaxID=5321 RepID=A0ACB7IHV6_PLECO|nr:hypothetical protein CCMSSC00406_0008482 [Pleurotus cornucopiae]